MNRGAIASVLTVTLAMPALAAAKYYLVRDPVDICSIVHSKPAPHSGLTIIGQRNGYGSVDAIDKDIDAKISKCKDIITSEEYMRELRASAEWLFISERAGLPRPRSGSLRCGSAPTLLCNFWLKDYRQL